MNFNIVMENLLFFAAIAMLGISVVLFFIQQIVCSGKDLDIFKHLLKDKNYPVEIIDERVLSKYTSGGNDFNLCWVKTVFRKRTTAEETLLHHAKWLGRCGGFGLFLSFSKLPPIFSVLLGIMFALSIVGVYRGFISGFFEMKTFKKAWLLYKTQQKEQG